MVQATKATRQNRTLTIDFQDPSTYFELINDGKAFVEFAQFLAVCSGPKTQIVS